jgi:hypothetical protein
MKRTNERRVCFKAKMANLMHNKNQISTLEKIRFGLIFISSLFEGGSHSQ